MHCVQIVWACRWLCVAHCYTFVQGLGKGTQAHSTPLSVTRCCETRTKGWMQPGCTGTVLTSQAACSLAVHGLMPTLFL